MGGMRMDGDGRMTWSALRHDFPELFQDERGGHVVEGGAAEAILSAFITSALVPQQEISPPGHMLSPLSFPFSPSPHHLPLPLRLMPMPSHIWRSRFLCLKGVFVSLISH